MNKYFRSVLQQAILLIILTFIGVGCSGIMDQTQTSPTISPPTQVISTDPTSTPTVEIIQTPTVMDEPTSEPMPEETLEEGVLYQDDFRDLETGWPQFVFDNSYLGYHEPEWYHIEIQTANDDEIVAIPDANFEDFTVEVDVFTETTLSQAEGNYRYGLVLRRSGNKYYAFTISPVTQEWFVLKRTPTELQVIQGGSDDGIHAPGEGDTLRVDVRGSDFFFHINDHPVTRISDADYAIGELGFVVQTLDNQKVHIHYDAVRIQEVQVPQLQEGLLYQDDFRELETGWPQFVFDNSYLGYHEPEWYHIEIQTANDDEIVAIPDASFEDFTIEVDVFTETTLSQAEGNYRYGIIFRRSGNQYYALTISPVTQEWFVLKRTPTELEVLQGGSDDGIHAPGEGDKLRVDARGPEFFFHINEQPVTRISDMDYASGELGFVVQTLDNQKVHIHYDSVLVREVDAPQWLCTVDTLGLNLRSGPGTTHRIFTTLSHGDQIEPLGRTQDQLWIQVQVKESGQTGWVANDRPYFECNVPIPELPVRES